MPIPIGMDGFFNAWCPPYFPNMNAAVDDLLGVMYGPQGTLTKEHPGKRPFLDTENAISKYPKLDEEAAACTRAVCDHVYQNYGRFPSTVEPWDVSIMTSVHHIDIDFYTKYYPPEVISEEKRKHMEVWHRD